MPEFIRPCCADTGKMVFPTRGRSGRREPEFVHVPVKRREGEGDRVIANGTPVDGDDWPPVETRIGHEACDGPDLSGRELLRMRPKAEGFQRDRTATNDLVFPPREAGLGDTQPVKDTAFAEDGRDVVHHRHDTPFVVREHGSHGATDAQHGYHDMLDPESGTEEGLSPGAVSERLDYVDKLGEFFIDITGETHDAGEVATTEVMERGGGNPAPNRPREYAEILSGHERNGVGVVVHGDARDWYIIYSQGVIG